MTTTTPASSRASSTPASSAGVGTQPARARGGRLVIDAPTRAFHWLFASSFVGAYLTAESEHWRAMHVTLGYVMAGLLLFRVVYGMVGPRQAALGLWWRKAAGIRPWLRSAARSHSWSAVPWRQGPHVTLAFAVLALLCLTVPLTLTGYAAYEQWGEFLGGEWVADLHAWLGDAFLIVVLAHVGIIVAMSAIRRTDLARPMFSGRLPGHGPDLVRRNRGWLAALLLAAVLGFGAWQWRQAPHGLIPLPMSTKALGIDLAAATDIAAPDTIGKIAATIPVAEEPSPPDRSMLP